jgi:opacity protein-like surface antigen
MKKLLTIFCLVLLVASTVNAQEFKKFRWGLGGGYAIPSGKGAKGGVCFYSEPGYRISDQILANLRMEWAVVARGLTEDLGVELDVAAIGSWTLNGQYYFNNNGFRPFAGLGFGIYSLKAATINNTDVGATATSKFGFYPRVGFDAGHFTLAIDYNIVPEVDGIKNSYIGIKLGGYFGGGRK